MIVASSMSDQPTARHGSPERRRWSRKWVPITVIAVVIFSFVNVAISLSRPTIPDEIEGLMLYPDVTPTLASGPVDYNTIPPVGGAHSAYSLECGIYYHPISNEDAVATMATGAVWFAYREGADERTTDLLKDFTEGEYDTFMAPYPDLPEPIVITAWGAQLVPDGPDDVRIASFLRDYKNSDLAPYPDAPCHAKQEIPPAAD